MQIRALVQLVAIAAVGGIAGCASVDTPGLLAKEWSKRFREYQIYPTFPPREDLQVGDVYLACTESDGLLGGSDPGRREPISIFVTSLDTRKVLHDHYAARLSLPETVFDGRVGQGTVKTDPHGVSAAKSEVFPTAPRTPVLRLRAVAFPEFASATVSGGSLGALVPAEAFLAGLGVSTEDVSSVSISVPAAESYGLPWLKLKSLWEQDELMKNGSALAKSLPGFIKPRSAEDAAGCKNGVQYVVVSEVFLARAIDVKMDFKSSVAARLGYDMSLDPNSKKKAVFDALAKGSGPAAGDKPAPGAAQPGKPAADAAERAKALLAEANETLKQIEESTKREFPGVTAKIYSGGAAGITLTRVYAQPIAIGYRGVVFDEHGKPKPTPTVPLGGEGVKPEAKR